MERMQLKGKLKNQSWENGEKTNFKSDFGPFGPNDPQNFFTSTSSSTLFQAIIFCNLNKN